MLTPEQTLSDMALAHPAASRVFRKHQLDFCCGGNRSLRDACAVRKVSPEAVLDEIAAEEPAALPRDPRVLSTPELIDYLLVNFHEAHRRELPDLIQLARKVERVHHDKPEVPAGLEAHLIGMQQALESHMHKEEAVLFPAILRGAGIALTMPIQVMEAEHEEHGQNLARLRALTKDFVPPPPACTSWKALYLRCEQLEADVMAHVHLENHVLFPRVLGSRGASS